MGNTTVYDVVARLSMQDRGSRGIANFTRAADDAWRSTNRLQGVLARVGGVAAGVFTARAAYSSLITYNRGLEDTRNSLATIINLNQKGPWEASVARGARLMEQFKEDAKTSAGTMKDMAEFASTIINPVLQAGGTLDDLRLFTKQAVVAAASMGVSNEVAAMDMIQALRGTASAKDKMTMGLLGSIGMDNEKFNALSGEQRFATMKKLLTSEALTNAAKAQGGGLTGLMSTTMDNLEQMFGKVGQGLYASLKGTFLELNTWIEQNQDKIRTFGTELGQIFKTAFGVAKDAFKFLVDHKDLLLHLAQAWLAGKAVKGLGNGMIEGFGKLVTLGDAIDEAGGGLKGLAKSAGGALFGLQALYVAASQIATWVDEHHDTNLDEQAKKAALDNQFAAARQRGGGSAITFYDNAKAQGLVDNKGRLKYDAYREQIDDPMLTNFSAMQAALDKGRVLSDSRKADRILAGVTVGLDRLRQGLMLAHAAQLQTWVEQEKLRNSFKQLAASNKEIVSFGGTLGGLFKTAFSHINDMLGFVGLGGFFGKAKPVISINKLVIDVKSDDPDRLVQGIEGYLTDYLRNGTPPTSLRAG